MRVPGGDRLPGFHLIAVVHGDRCPVADLVALLLAALFIDHAQLARPRYRDIVPVLVPHQLHVVHVDRAGGLHRDAAGGGRAVGRTADMERAHGQLGAGLADGLRGHHADGLADVDQVTARQVPPVAHRADPVAGLAVDRRAHLDLVHAQVLELLAPALIEQGAGRDQDVLALGIHDVGGDHAPEHPALQGLHHVAALDHGFHHHAVGGPAVVLGDHQVLGDVHQAPRQVTGVGGLERGIGESLARTVRGDEVLQHVQALAEVRGDGRLDDGAVRLGHQAAHARQLADLGGRAPRPGVGHHVDGVE